MIKFAGYPTTYARVLNPLHRAGHPATLVKAVSRRAVSPVAPVESVYQFHQAISPVALVMIQYQSYRAGPR